MATQTATSAVALAALVFLYRHVLGIDLEMISGIKCARRPLRLRVVLSEREVRAVIGALRRRRGSLRF